MTHLSDKEKRAHMVSDYPIVKKAPQVSLRRFSFILF
jgi:hypothetical protein